MNSTQQLAIRGTVAILMACIGGAGSAASSWSCDIRTNASSDAIPEKVIFEEKDGEVILVDTITYAFTDRAAFPEVKRSTKTRLEMVWRTGSGHKVTGSDVQLQYSATFLRKKKLLMISGLYVGYDNAKQSARGNCTKINAAVMDVIRAAN